MPFHPLDNGVEISCDAFNNDEIGHVTLIPVGEHAGRLLVWTRVDNRDIRNQNGCPYKSHVLSLTLNGWKVEESMSFDPALPDIADGPFCAGHTWMLDANGDPKFLLAGGLRYVPGSPPNPASSKVIWFDPLDTTPQPRQWWFDTPGDLPAPSWYPSVIPFLDPNEDVFRPIAVGGSLQNNPVNCDTLYTEWWTMSVTPIPTWTTQSFLNIPYWQGYPRTFLLASATDAGEVLMAGLDQGCDEPAPYGGNPCKRIDTGVVPQLPNNGPDPNDVLDETIDPPEPLEIWSWNNSQPVILRTLNNTNFTADPEVAIDQYDLNGVIVNGGTKREFDGAPAYPYTLGYDDNGPNEKWVRLADAPEARVFANFTLLPTREILLTGGQSLFLRGGGDPANLYRNTAALYDPDSDGWTTLATRQPVIGNSPMPRGYHSVAILLPDGSVALMGGQHETDLPLNAADTEDSVERYLPPYFFQGVRPSMSEVPLTIQYGTTFKVRVLVGTNNPPGGTPSPLEVRFCLMEIGSVTHHFDYGQRYVDLLSTTLPNGKKQILAPPHPTLAPEGYYMLFAVDSLGRPSSGSFVKLTF